MDNKILGMRRKISRWDKKEINILIFNYKKGASRNQIASILGRTSGSVANKIRMLIISNVLLRRR